MAESHPGLFCSEYYGWPVAGWTGEGFMAGNLEPAVGTPNVLVPAGYENGLPHAQVFEGAAAFPFRWREPCGLEGPRCFLLPPGELVYSLLAALMEEASVPVGGEDC